MNNIAQKFLQQKYENMRITQKHTDSHILHQRSIILRFFIPHILLHFSYSFVRIVVKSNQKNEQLGAQHVIVYNHS